MLKAVCLRGGNRFQLAIFALADGHREAGGGPQAHTLTGTRLDRGVEMDLTRAGGTETRV